MYFLFVHRKPILSLFSSTFPIRAYNIKFTNGTKEIAYNSPLEKCEKCFLNLLF